MTQNGPRSYEDVTFNTYYLFGALFRALPRILFITALLCGLTYVATSFMAKEYTSEASVLLEPRSDSFAESSSTRAGGVSQAAVDDAAIASQIQLLKSRETLLSVVDKLDLRSNDEFSSSSPNPLALLLAVFSSGSASENQPNSSLDDKIVSKLRKNLTAAQARDSRVISIKYKAGDAQTAADVANAIAKALVARRSGLAIEDTSDATKWLDQEIDRLRKDVLDAESKVANFRVENDLFQSGQNTTLIGQQLSDLARQISVVTERKNSATTRARSIRNLLRSGQSLDTVPDVRQSPIVQRMSEQKANFQASRAQAAATLLANHPTLQALDAQIRDIDRQIQVEGRRIAESLETQAEIEGELEKSLKDELVRLKLSASGAERSSVELAELEREATAKRNLLNTFLARQNEATARTNTGAIFPDVRIISTASVPSRPSWPNKPLLLVLVGAISLIIQIGMLIIKELAAGNLITARANVARSDEVQRSEEVVDVSEPVVATQEYVEAEEPEQVEPPAQEVVAPETQQISPVVRKPNPVALEKTTTTKSVVQKLIVENRNIVLVANAANQRTDSVLADELLNTLGANGRSAIVINAGGPDQFVGQGLTDMCDGDVDFGDIIHRADGDEQYFVPWGTKQRLNYNSERFELMVEALTEIYDHVIVECGRIGLRAPLAPFADTDAALLMVTSDKDDVTAAELLTDLNAIGINDVQEVRTPDRQAHVA